MASSFAAPISGPIGPDEGLDQRGHQGLGGGFDQRGHQSMGGGFDQRGHQGMGGGPYQQGPWGYGGGMDPPDSPLSLRVVLLLGLLLSLVLHLLLIAPLFGRYLGLPAAPRPMETPVEVTFESQPEPQKLAQATPPERDMVPATPEVDLETEPPAEPRPEAKPEPEPKPKPKLEPKPAPKRELEPARKLPPKPKPKPKPKPEPEPEPKPEPKPEQVKPLKVELYNMKLVDQENPEDEPPPRDAKLLAQQNRDVKDQTRAKHTNLDEHHDRTQLSSEAPKAVGSLTREDKSETRVPDRAVKETAGTQKQDRIPKEPVANTPRVEAGEEKPPEEKPPQEQPREVAREAPTPEKPRVRVELLAMRGRHKDQDKDVLQPPALPESPRGTHVTSPAHRTPSPHPAATPPPPRQNPSSGVVARDVGRRPRLQLTPQDADRVFGKQWAAEISESHKRRGSRGPESKRWERIKAALENYIPEVREGNQTALKTRAHPFAKFITAMHRKIHPLWGDGFLVDLQRLPAHDAFNNFSLVTKIEMVLDNRGHLVRAGVVHPSGFLAFDVAALDVVYQAEPYVTPPQSILSPDGRVYLHWRFNRNHRQCGTFNVDPFILAEPPGGRQDRRAEPGETHDEGRTGHALRRREGTGKAEVARPAPPKDLDERALGSATAWIAGFLQGSPERMVAASRVPFSASGRLVAKSAPELRKVFASLIEETSDRRTQTQAKLLTAAGLRATLGALPRGVQPGTDQLFVVTRYGGEDLVLILGQGNGGWAVTGLGR